MTTEPIGPPPPDDDPRFERWIADVGPLREMPPFEVSRSLYGAFLVFAGLAVAVTVAGWGVFGYALGYGNVNVGLLLVMLAGTVLVTTGCVGLYLGRPRP